MAMIISRGRSLWSCLFHRGGVHAHGFQQNLIIVYSLTSFMLYILFHGSFRYRFLVMIRRTLTYNCDFIIMCNF